MTTSTLPSAVSVTGLRKSFGGRVVLDGIDLDVAEGTIFSLLGPNGAGKTTAVQILSTLLRADAGEVRVAGFDVAHQPEGVRAAIGVTGQFSAVDNLLTGEENLMLMADLHPGANCHHVNSTVPSGRAVEELIRSARWRSSRKKPHSDGRGRLRFANSTQWAHPDVGSDHHQPDAGGRHLPISARSSHAGWRRRPSSAVSAQACGSVDRSLSRRRGHPLDANARESGPRHGEGSAGPLAKSRQGWEPPPVRGFARRKRRTGRLGVADPAGCCRSLER